MRFKTPTAIALVAFISLGAGAAMATPPSGLTSQLLGRGAAGEFRVADHNAGLRLVATQPTDLAFVKANLAPNGSTGWHEHPGPSLVVVSAGSLTMREPHHRHCTDHAFVSGEAFVHPAGVHNFEAGAAGAEFYVAYFVPAGAAPLLIDVPVVPAGCE